MHAISYIRFSSARQAGGSTVERQTEMVDAYLASHPDTTYHPDMSFSDLGISGFTGKNMQHGLGKIIAAAEAGHLDSSWVVLVEQWDRLGRQPVLDMLAILQRLFATGVSVHTLVDGQTYSSTSINENAGSIYVLCGSIQSAWQYSENLSKRVKASWKSRKASDDPVPRRLPFWFTPGTAGSELDTARAATVHECFVLAAQGEPPSTLRDRIIDRHPGTLTTVQGVRKMLRNPLAMGVYLDKPMYPAAIDRETWYAVQAVLDSRKIQRTRQPRRNDLAGLLKCGDCGSSMQLIRHGGNRQPRWMCGLRQKQGKAGNCGNDKTIPWIVAEYIFTESSLHIVNEYLSRNEPDQALQAAAISGELSELRQTEARLVRLLSNYDSPEVETQLQEVIARREALATSQKALDQTDSTPLAPNFDHDDLEGLTKWMRSTKHRVTCFPDGRIWSGGTTWKLDGYSRATNTYTVIEPDGTVLQI